MQVRVIASERPALQASEGRFAKRIPANIALQDTCLLQASDSRFARYIPANVALQASESRVIRCMGHKATDHVSRDGRASLWT